MKNYFNRQRGMVGDILVEVRCERCKGHRAGGELVGRVILGPIGTVEPRPVVPMVNVAERRGNVAGTYYVGVGSSLLDDPDAASRVEPYCARCSRRGRIDRAELRAAFDRARASNAVELVWMRA